MASVRQAPPKRQDRTLYCLRCGIAFLWPAEEQKAPPPVLDAPSDPRASGDDGNRPDASRPVQGETTAARTVRPNHCPACRRLLPAAGRERGLVKWYNRRKRFGFITRKDQPDLFVHGSALRDKKALSPDELVEFSVAENDRGLTAAEVARLTLSPTQHPPEHNGEDDGID